MKRLKAILFILSFGCSSVCLAAAENPNVSTSFSSTTRAPSDGQRRRLLTSPNPLSATGNNVVTGNVGGMRYFHGVVPYGSQYYSSANLGDTGTGSVTSFLRRSTDPILSDRNPGQTRVFYEPRRAVSSFYVQNGQRTALSQTTPRARTQDNTISLPNLLDEPVRTSPQQRPLSSNRQELDEILSRQFELKERAKEQARRSVLDSDKEFKNFFDVVLKPEEVRKEGLEEPVTREILKEPEPRNRTETERDRGEPLDPAQRETLQTERDEQETLRLPDQLPTRTEIPVQPDETEMTDEDEPQTDAMETLLEEAGQRSQLRANARRVLGEHESVESLARSKFTDYMQAAEELIRQGKFYQAADAYSLAAVWQSKDARPYLGQSFALFAAGEYMSSAYYLSRAIELESAIASRPYDLAGLIGDRDIFENRLIEMSTWQQRSGSGELAFLMAYILYQDGKPARAAEAIAKAEAAMPDNPAVATLKDVIESADRNAP